ncbi:CobQ/CobB/MinD/ParA nucleotide binding domain protein [Micromonospora sp. MW-13]|uniref:ParA family protein n=1 Tax=unclassified Micromonospora TaxID=2617518 RepID=UPI000E447884|nr:MULTISPECIES: AAA family ATPase [unclassified Micromonospora]MCX4474016.1 AAA family ATPase [Micromonospora sp. NBC_01655]RGC69889.1 CobQ/CobB/MinD/ParA nucleotide binding domain protein [Micromonospora sp. MW-13]
MNDDQPNADQPGHPDHLFTWLDVNQYFADLARHGGWPHWLREVDAYWDSARFVVDPTVPANEVWAWLRNALGPLTVEPENAVLLLDDAGPDGPQRPLAIEIEATGDVPPAERRPRWNDRRVVAELATVLPEPQSALPHEVSVVAFHSFKGGVGRTLHCVATARRLVELGRKVLLIDADLEAPGVTWMVADSTRIDFAYEDFLALVHGAVDETYVEAISLGRKFLANQELGGVVVLPARRDHLRVAPPRIEPVDLLTTDRDPYVLTEALAELGHAVGADTVLVDLRAGSSELSAPLLLDPRVLRVFVTSISDQSVRGTRQILHELARRAPGRQPSHPDCALLLTQFHAVDHGNRLSDVVAELRDSALEVSGRIGDLNNDLPATDAAIPIMTSRFEPGLLNLPANWDEVVALIARLRLTDVVATLVEALPATTKAPASVEAEPTTVEERRHHLAGVADAMIYAEQTAESDFLTTDALRNLAEAHRTELPVEVVIGGKGAGKTFTFMQLCRRSDWASFVRDVGVSNASLDVPTVPVLASTNLSDESANLIDRLRSAASVGLTGRKPASRQAIRDLIAEALTDKLTQVGWRRVWLACFARSIGLDSTPAMAEEALTSFARDRSAVFVLDGLEDMFPKFAERAQQQDALQALLVGCPEWLRTLRGRPLGLVAFVRRDLALAAIRQNPGQFEKRYEKYSLRWNTEEALRLAAWVCQRGRSLPNVSSEDIRTATEARLSELMSTVWGEKMGSAKSKEARSEVWFFAALSDFRGQIQARDIVAFLATAAAESLGADQRWSDRVLAPAAMRNALPKCSEQKIEAIRLENPPVRELLDRLRDLDVDRKKVPFRLESVGLSSEEARLLDTNGVVFREGDQYWIPEIFRHGLGFSVQGRPRVVAMAKLVRRRNDISG